VTPLNFKDDHCGIVTVTITHKFLNLIFRIQHSKVAIIKPQRKTVEQSLEEVEEAIRGGAIGATMEIGKYIIWDVGMYSYSIFIFLPITVLYNS
jgi:hypothetical protein